MTQDNRYVDGEPVVAQRVVTETTYAPVVEAVEPIRRAHPGLIPLALASLLGLLSLFLPFARISEAWTRTVGAVTENVTANTTFNFWNIFSGQRTWLLLLLLGALLLGLIGYFTRAVWARYLAGLLGLIAGIWLLVRSLFAFNHSGLGNFFTGALNATLGSGIGRWLMALAGLGLLATAIWSFLRGGDDVDTDTVR